MNCSQVTKDDKVKVERQHEAAVKVRDVIIIFICSFTPDNQNEIVFATPSIATIISIDIRLGLCFVIVN